MKTTFGRTFFTYVVIVMAALVLVGVSFQMLSRKYLTERAVDRLKNESTVIAQVAAAYYTDDALRSKDFLLNLSVAANVSGTNAVICDASGRLVMCSDAPLGCEHQGLIITSREFLQQIRQQEYVVSNGVIEGLYEEPRYVVSTAVRPQAAGEAVAIVIVSSPVDNTLGTLKKLSDFYLVVSLVVILAAVAVVTYYARKTSAPLRDMARTATAFGHGDLQARANVPQESPEEIRNLALAFNNMARSLEKSEYQRKEFVANVSHELKSPMTTIGGYVDGILDGTIPESQQKRYLQIVSDETKRLSRLVRSMLDISRLQTEGSIPEEKKSRFDVCECAGQVLITFEGKINEKNLNVEVDMPEYAVYTVASQDYITQVLYNLLDNAVKFSPEGGAVGLRLRQGGNKLYISVFNEGQTIPAQELPLLFDRFHKLDKSRSENRDGWGLGLYIVKTLVCSHGEDISVSSKDGRTEFTFTLPAAN